ncbi:MULTISPECIES: hypothetical protein, partial [unclassified Bradyrhizobium]|uniref:hypothetical protein n=1 Tax=unclassified Bradyrhizobium TaxID=2631580 RepID=UPI001FF832BE
GWPHSFGSGGRFRSESVAAFRRNRWPLCPGFRNFVHQERPDDAARVFNRLYLGQLLEMPSTRHCFADDAEIEGDLQWAGFDRFDGRGDRGRYKREVRHTG